MIILGIESSCDETAAAVVKDGRTLLSNVVFSQESMHGRFRGIVPEIASRAHVEHINTVLEEALRGGKGFSSGSIDAVAPQSVDLLLCNVTADVISAIYNDIHRVMRPQGLAIFSGILNFQVPGVLQVASSHSHATLEQTTRGEWSALVMRNMNVG